MIRESQSWTPSELIYLFVDGEADDVQKSMLFTALANDTGLQAELSDALRINTAARDADEQPPAHVTAALFRKAGFSLTAEETATRGAGIAAGAGSAALIEGAGTVGTGFRLRGLIIPFVSAFIGGMLTLLLAPEMMQQQDAATLPPHFAASTQQSDAKALSGPNNLPNAHESFAPAAASARQGIQGAAQSKTARTKSLQEAFAVVNEAKGKEENGKSNTANHNDGGIVNGRQQHAERSPNGIEAERITEDATVKVNTSEILPTEIEAARESEIDTKPMRHVDPAADPIRAIEVENTGRKKEETTRDGFAAAQEQSIIDQNLLLSLSAMPSAALQVERPLFAMQVRGITELEVFPHRSLNTGKPVAFENMAIAGFYNISSNHAIGIEMGREYHPLYVPTTSAPGGSISVADVQNPSDPGIGITINGTGADLGSLGSPGLTGNTDIRAAAENNSTNNTPSTSGTSQNTKTGTGFELEPRSTWMGLAYQFRANAIDQLGMIRPYVQGVIGGTQFGPAGKGTIGLSWTPDNKVSFNLGIEGTAILYRNNGDWYSSRKLGLTYSAQVNF